MVVGKFEPLTYFEIWEPRYRDKVVLLNAGKVDRATTKFLKLKFTKAPSMEGDWVIEKARAKRCKKESNGTIQCYAVPLSELHVLEIDEKDMRGF